MKLYSKMQPLLSHLLAVNKLNTGKPCYIAWLRWVQMKGTENIDENGYDFEIFRINVSALIIL